ncbi:sulfotransferase [Mesorhizobium sp. VK22B]|uniref:Sulfotransferase n=1 Tax=Mesorhizobium captivum TaxID=3072319 RepID=A0ABU4YX17_9HYPH|nr:MULTISPECIES: sulfotransferase [unclassified Mesorhizobium]MDX8491502.1 sulfotransferase [Mesorhizobium sp. VK22B]MDX8505255.1 sulfotransferase [Mesorhizobium sp. VK22E]
MTGTRRTTKRRGRAASLEVDAWTDAIGRLLERFPRFWIKVGNWETRLLAEQLDHTSVSRPIYIAGLARSGSTILLELLASHPDTASHRYRDFPLVPALMAWNWFVDRAGRTEQLAVERAHRDRIKVTPESPEALEEIVWMAFFPSLHDPSTNAVLDEAARHPCFEAFYRDHIRKLLLLRNAGRYLAKGNYNVTRLRYLRRLFPDARFIVPIRDPTWHIASLMKQHRLFSDAEGKDRRVVSHMRRSGHFEFGLNRVPVNVDGRTAGEIVRLWKSGRDVAGWAAYWASVYGYVAAVLDDPAMAGSMLVVRYEDLCSDPAATLSTILDHCELDDCGLARAAQATVSFPAYYEPSFTQAERNEIRRRTAAVAGRFGYG